MSEPLRRSGLEVFGDLAWGGHFSVFYESRDDLLDCLVPYFNAGLSDNELCFLAVSAPFTVAEMHEALTRHVPDFARHLSAGRMEIVDGRQWYEAGNLKSVIEAWMMKLDTALAKGFEGLRLSGNAFWMERRDRDDFLAYEQEIDDLFAGLPLLALCTYPILHSYASDILDVASSHQQTAVRRKNRWEVVVAAGLSTAHRLSTREVEVLDWVARGKSAWEIGRILGIAKRTVDAHVCAAAQKLGASNRAEAIAIAIHRNIIALEDFHPLHSGNNSASQPRYRLHRPKRQ